MTRPTLSRRKLQQIPLFSLLIAGLICIEWLPDLYGVVLIVVATVLGAMAAAWYEIRSVRQGRPVA